MAPNPPIADNEIPSSAKWNTGVYVYDVSGTEVDVTNTTTETEIYRDTIGAGHMSTERSIRVALEGDLLSNAAGAPTVRVKFGPSGSETVLWGHVPSFASDADRRPWSLEVKIANRASAGVQRLSGRLILGAAVAGSVAGQGGDAGAVHEFGAAGAINTAVAVDVVVTVQWSTASTSQSWRKLSADMELR